MNATIQQIIALFIVALTVLLFLRKRKSSSCGGGCHCEKPKSPSLSTKPPQDH